MAETTTKEDIRIDADEADELNREAADDLAVDANLTRSRPLDDGAHQRAPRAEPRPPKPVDPPRWPASRERSAPGRVCGDTEDLP